MYNFISILILIVCLLLVLIVLVQNSKGGGLASNFAETGQMMGVRKTADFLEKATWTLAGDLQPRGHCRPPTPGGSAGAIQDPGASATYLLGGDGDQHP